MLLFSQQLSQVERDNEERQIALEYLAEAWNSAERDGIETEALAHAAIFAAFATLVKAFGEDATAELIAKLPERIRHGEYSIDKSIQ